MVKSAAGSTPLAYSSPKAVQTTGTIATSASLKTVRGTRRSADADQGGKIGFGITVGIQELPIPSREGINSGDGVPNLSGRDYPRRDAGPRASRHRDHGLYRSH